MTAHHLTASKLLITLLNRMGHCSSYDEIQADGISLAMEVLARAEEYGTVVPSNIFPGPFVQNAADINEETLDGIGIRPTRPLWLYIQRKQFGPAPPTTGWWAIQSGEGDLYKQAVMSTRYKSVPRTAGDLQLQSLSTLVSWREYNLHRSN